MQIVLLRHGATDWNLQGRCQGTTDLALSEVGARQAEEIADSLGRESIHAVYASDLKRARQTAEAIGRAHRLPVTVEANIRELDHGKLEGLTFAEIKKTFPEFIKKWRTEPAELLIPGGERLIDVARRTWSAMNRIADRHEAGETVVIVSHNFPIVAFLCRVTETPLNRYRTFHLDPCGLTRLSYDRDRGWRITHINNIAYSPEPTAARP